MAWELRESSPDVYTVSMHRIAIFALTISAVAWADGAGGLHWTTPASWKNDGTTRPMRAVTYAVPAATGDPEPVSYTHLTLPTILRV